MNRIITAFVTVLGPACLAVVPTFAQDVQPATTQPAQDIAKEHAPQAVQVLKRSRQACLNATSAMYDFDVVGTGMLRMIGRLEGNAMLSRVVDTWDSMIYVRTEMGAAPGAPGDANSQYIVATDGTILTGLTDRTMLYYEGMVADGATDLIPGLGGNGLARPFIDKDPFEDELGAQFIRYRGETVVDGKVCDLVEAEMPGKDPDKVRWAIDREKSLPRQYQMIYPGYEEDESLFTLTLRNLTIDEPVDPSMFYVEPRQGYDRYSFVKHMPLGTTVSEWSLETPDGETVSSVDLEGHQVMLYFWTCESFASREHLEEFELLRQEYESRGVAFHAVTFAERDGDDPVSMARARGYEGSLLVGGDELAKELGIPVVPTLAILDGQHRLHAQLQRFKPDKRQFIFQTLDRLLNK